MYLSPAQKLGLPLLAVTLPVALVVSTIVFGDTVKSGVPTNQIVKVRGVADRVIVAESSGSKLGGLRAARQGAFEGLGSDGFVGGHDREERIRAIVTVDYAIGG